MDPLLEASIPAGSLDDRISHITPVLYWFLIVPLIPLVFLAIRRIYISTVVKRRTVSAFREMHRQADEYIRLGMPTSAAVIYEEKLHLPDRAAPLFEKGGDLVRAASAHLQSGRKDKAMMLYEEAGEFEEAAELASCLGKHDNAARLYGQAGKHHESAICLQRAGRKMAAAKEYRVAGEYKKAAALLEELEMPSEAAEMYSISIRNARIESSSLEEFYRYAVLLEKAGQPEKALGVLNEISAIDAQYMDVSGRIQALRAATQGTGESAAELQGKSLDAGTSDMDEIAETEAPAQKEKEKTLRDIINSYAGKPLAPKESVRLWVLVLKALKEYQQKNGPHLRFSPECIFVSGGGFEIRKAEAACCPAYLDPEGPNPYSDMYAMGVMLFEMLTGAVSGLNPDEMRKRLPSAVNTDVPAVLDGVFSICIAPPSKRFKGPDEALAALKSASRGK